METDEIVEIGINEQARLYIKPASKNFSMIYREAMEVHWDQEGRFLYSPKPREWNYLDWYRQIIRAVNSGSFRLEFTDKTKWVNIGDNLKENILNEYRASNT